MLPAEFRFHRPLLWPATRFGHPKNPKSRTFEPFHLNAICVCQRAQCTVLLFMVSCYVRDRATVRSYTDGLLKWPGVEIDNAGASQDFTKFHCVVVEIGGQSGWLVKAGVPYVSLGHYSRGQGVKGSRFLEFHFATGSSFGSLSQQLSRVQAHLSTCRYLNLFSYRVTKSQTFCLVRDDVLSRVLGNKAGVVRSWM